VPDPTV